MGMRECLMGTLMPKNCKISQKGCGVLNRSRKVSCRQSVLDRCVNCASITSDLAIEYCDVLSAVLHHRLNFCLFQLHRICGCLSCLKYDLSVSL